MGNYTAGYGNDDDPSGLTSTENNDDKDTNTNQNTNTNPTPKTKTNPTPKSKTKLGLILGASISGSILIALIIYFIVSRRN